MLLTWQQPLTQTTDIHLYTQVLIHSHGSLSAFRRTDLTWQLTSMEGQPCQETQNPAGCLSTYSIFFKTVFSTFLVYFKKRKARNYLLLSNFQCFTLNGFSIPKLGITWNFLGRTKSTIKQIVLKLIRIFVGFLFYLPQSWVQEECLNIYCYFSATAEIL